MGSGGGATLRSIAFAAASLALLGQSALATDYIAESNGFLSFPADEHGYRIPDFSYAGYMNSNVDLPTFGVEYGEGARVPAPTGNAKTNQTNIQNAIDAVEALPLNEHGYRGAVVFGAGTWEVVDSGEALRVEASGVVLRGAGMDATIIQDFDNNTPTVLQIGPYPTNNPPDIFDEGRDGVKWDITSEVVHVGDMTFELEAGHGLQVGDEIIVEHPCTAAWIAAVDNGGAVAGAPWAVGEVPIRYWRTVKAVSGTTVTIDVPVMYSLARSLSQSFVYKYTGEYVEKCGLEHLTVDVDHNGLSTVDIAPFNAIQFNNTKDSWARNVRAQNFRASGFAFNESRNFTVKECESIDPHSVITSARRYNFSNRGGQNGLFVDCYSRRARHSFVTNGHAMDSGNVYLRCIADDAYAASEHGHQRWSNGSLWDGCHFRIVGSPESGAFFDHKVLWLGNHGDNSNTHGWAAVTGVAYKSIVDAPGYAILAKPPTAMNYEIDCQGDWRSDHFAWGDYPGALGISTSGTLPASLFEAQLAQRLGVGGASWSANRASIDYGYQALGRDVDLALTLTNVSGDPISGDVTENSIHYDLLQGGSFTNLGDGDTHQVTLRYSPSMPGAHQATLTVTGGSGLQIPVSGTAVPLQASLSFSASDGLLVSPMTNHGSYIATTGRDEGLAVYAIDVPASGDYQVATVVDAAAAGSNSFFVAFDSVPTESADVWDIIELTSGFEERMVSLRGHNGTFESPEFAPATWALEAGIHYLFIQGRETDTRLQSIALSRSDLAVPPKVTILSPAEGVAIDEGTALAFSAAATSETEGDLSNAIAWTSSLDGALAETGGSFSTAALSAGTHIITATAVDSQGLQGEDGISITILAAPIETPPNDPDSLSVE